MAYLSLVVCCKIAIMLFKVLYILRLSVYVSIIVVICTIYRLQFVILDQSPDIRESDLTN